MPRIAVLASGVLAATLVACVQESIDTGTRC